MGSANNNQAVSSDMDIEMGTSLSSGQDVDVLSNDNSLHSEENACSEDVRITRELSEDSFSHYYDDTIMSDSKFYIQLVGDKCPSLGKEHPVKLLNEIKQLRV
ncbi:hypothetical protein INT46_005709 [Mucor plumbeus]|uniref:Uncharacterized protein n=1 Tax=Mucor plumbeus TaxID=97098 RepID=A0A8H7UQ07_9FUNG|nr:hypothetical protein INT46_005709 [Mucor plumbeus]